MHRAAPSDAPILNLNKHLKNNALDTNTAMHYYSTMAQLIHLDVRTSKQTELVPITDQVQQAVRENDVENGVCYLYVPHTTAAVTINENADPMVAHDILYAIDKLIPLKDSSYRHMEGNSAAHVKACLFGASETVLIRDSRLVLGTWQGVFFCEFDGPRNRQIYVKIIEG